MEVIAWGAAIVGLLLGTVTIGKAAYRKLLMPTTRFVAKIPFALHRARLRSIQAGATLPCVNHDCDQIVSTDGQQTLYCDACSMAVVKQEWQRTVASLRKTNRIVCTACKHEFSLACPKCQAPGILPLP